VGGQFEELMVMAYATNNMKWSPWQQPIEMEKKMTIRNTT